MMRLALALVVLATSTARAGSNHYVQGDVGLGEISPDGINVVFGIGGGYRVSAWLYVRAEITHAPTGGVHLEGDPGEGTGTQLRAGLEVKPCSSSGLVCGIFGADLGAQRGTWQSEAVSNNDSSGTVDALVVIPRAFFDIGSEAVRLRLGLELGFGIVSRSVHTSGPAFSGNGGSTGLVAGVAYQW